MVRPCKLNTIVFSRKLSDADRSILLVAGQGDLTRGFNFLLEIYSHLHAQGFRAQDPLTNVTLANNYQNDQVDSF